MQRGEVTVDVEMGEKIRDLIEEENSKWVFQNIKQINSMLSVMFDSLEEHATMLFTNREKKEWAGESGEVKIKSKK